MSEQTNQTGLEQGSLRDAVQALLDEGLDGPELIYRLRVLIPDLGENADAQSTTDDATVHPGYQ